jgi:deferrochelatase/peroxidase EfeB
MGATRAGLDRRILRHGITYGRGVLESGAEPDDDRGLLFLSYQVSISRQFEFLNNRWMNSPVNPRSPSGHDLIVGQNGAPKQNRVRTATVFGKDLAVGTVTTERDFVIPTGGEYFFSPSVSALREVLSASAPAPPDR